MTDNFDTLSTESDTHLASRSAYELAGMPARHEKWSWEGIAGESIVLLSQDAQQHDDETLKQMVREAFSLPQDAPMTLERRDDFTYINFNFVVDDY